MSLEGRTALITGAKGGLGSQMAITMAELGANLILLDLPNTRLSNILLELMDSNKKNIEIDFIECNLEDRKSRASAIEEILDKYSTIEILINNVAFVGQSNLEGWATDFESQSIETWERAMEVNLTSIFDLSKNLTPLIGKSKKGSIINIASIYSIVGPIHDLYKDTDMGNPAAYAASKGGLVQLTRWLSTTLAPDIRVNSISPGGIYNGQAEQFVDRYNNRTPMGRMANYDDFNGIAAYLASDLSSYMTGQNIIIDGGWTVW